MSRDHEAEIRASVAAHADLGPGYDDPVAEGLVERIGAEIDKRIDARLGQFGAPRAPGYQEPGAPGGAVAPPGSAAPVGPAGPLGPAAVPGPAVAGAAAGAVARPGSAAPVGPAGPLGPAAVPGPAGGGPAARGYQGYQVPVGYQGYQG